MGTGVIIIQCVIVSILSASLTKAGVLSRNRLSEADIAEWTGYNLNEPEGPGTYSFGYDVEDPETGNVQFRSEDRHRNGTVTGSYGFMSPDGYIHIVHYIADQLGYRTKIEDGGRLKSFQRRFSPNSDKSHQSPQMKAALQSVRNYRPTNKIYDQHVRPYDKTGSSGAVRSYANEQSDTNEFYNYYYVPSNQLAYY